MRLLVSAVLCALTVFAQEKPKSALDKPVLEAYVRHLLALPAEVQMQISDPKPSGVVGLKQLDVHMSLGKNAQDETFFVSDDGSRILRGLVFDVNKNPFQADLDKLKTDLSPSFGSPGAPVVMVVFSDFECPNCRDEDKLIRTNIPKTFPKEVRVYFKDFPLEQIHPWAKSAAIAGRCVFRQNPTAFWQYHDWMYEHQPEITGENLKDKVMEFSKSVPDVDAIQLARCYDTKATEGEVDKEIAEGKALHIEGTPTTFVNGRRLFGNYPWQNLQQIISMELHYQQTAKDAGEKCCEVSIPTPLKK